MDLPIQAAPVMRGQHRSDQLYQLPGVNLAVGQSQLPCDAICALVPAQYRPICQALCPVLNPPGH